MASHLWFYQPLLAALVWVCLLIHVSWPAPLRVPPPQAIKPYKPGHKRSKEPKPFAGYIYEPLCEACEHGIDSHPKDPGAAHPVIIFTRGRQRTVDAVQHFCLDYDCSYHGRLGRGNIRSNGHRGSQPWRQAVCRCF